MFWHEVAHSILLKFFKNLSCGYVLFFILLEWKSPEYWPRIVPCLRPKVSFGFL